MSKVNSWRRLRMKLRTYLLTGVGTASLLLGSYAQAGKGLSPESAEGAKTVTAQEAKVLWEKGAAFIDTRKDSDWEAGRVPGALHINIKKPEFSAENIQKYVDLNQPVVSYCNAEKCHRAYSGAKKLVSFGFTQVYYFRLGYPSWKNAGYPYE